MFSKFKNLHLFSSEYSRFQLVNGLTFVGIFLLVIAVITYNLYVIIDFNSAYVFALSKNRGFAGFDTDFKEAFVDYLLGNSIGFIGPILGVIIVLFFLGVYISNVLVRPFRFVSLHCENVLKNPHAEFEPDWLSGYRLFTRFAELFFSHFSFKKIVNGAPQDIYLPKYYARIHRPVTDWIFVSHFTLVMIIMTIISCMTIIGLNDALYEALLSFTLSYANVSASGSIEMLQYQNKLLYSMYLPVMVISIILNFLLAFYMYNKVSGAAFGVFSTMRSFLKGNYSARIHLIGYNVLRDNTRTINKYFEYLEGKLKTEKKDVV
jgi:hypothetical protein